MGPYSQHFILFTHNAQMGPISKSITLNKTEKACHLQTHKHSSLLCPFVSWEEIEVVWIWYQVPMLQNTMAI